MILVDRARALIQDLESSHTDLPAVVERLLSGHPRFQNIEYPLMIPPLLVDSTCINSLRQEAEAYVALLEKVIDLYRKDLRVRQFFGLDGAANELIDAEGSPHPAIHICRLDGYIDRGEHRLKILENNADCPAGTLFTPRLNRIMRDLIGPLIVPANLLAMDDGDPFVATLLDAASRRLGSKHPLRVLVLQARGSANVESSEIADVFRTLGHESAVADPRDISVTEDGAVWSHQRVDLIWNKINMSKWMALVREAPQLVETFTRIAAHSGAPVMLNSFGARHVAESKTALALIHDSGFRHRLSSEEDALVQRLIPFTARLDPNVQVPFEDRDWEIEELVMERQKELVIKQQYDIRGDGVTIGCDVDSSCWRDVLKDSWGRGAVLQRYVAPLRYPVSQVGTGTVTELNLSLDAFVFGGRLAGLGSKASSHHKVNLFQGGSKLAVMAIANAL